MTELQPIRFLLPHENGHATLDCVDYNTFRAWAIRDGFGHCLSHDGAWEEEPQPSSRSDEFIARTRYTTVDEAMHRWHLYLAEIRGRRAVV